jgi:hypothetical protein
MERRIDLPLQRRGGPFAPTRVCCHVEAVAHPQTPLRPSQGSRAPSTVRRARARPAPPGPDGPPIAKLSRPPAESLAGVPLLGTSSALLGTHRRALLLRSSGTRGPTPIDEPGHPRTVGRDRATTRAPFSTSFLLLYPFAASRSVSCTSLMWETSTLHGLAMKGPARWRDTHFTTLLVTNP